jgi:hypothetical protein
LQSFAEARRRGKLFALLWLWTAANAKLRRPNCLG